MIVCLILVICSLTSCIWINVKTEVPAQEQNQSEEESIDEYEIETVPFESEEEPEASESVNPDTAEQEEDKPDTTEQTYETGETETVPSIPSSEESSGQQEENEASMMPDF